jgi:lipid-A-disaccharide synthase
VPRALPKQTATIFISTGELSGEMHAALLVETLQRERALLGLPEAIFEGNGSERMRAAGVSLLFDNATWSELGILANLLKARHFQRVVKATARYIIGNRHDCVILVDNRVLNLALARMLREAGYLGKIVYYVAPVRWESLYDRAEHGRSLRNSRFLDIKRYCDFAILIYPVSLDVYRELNIPHLYIGHPLCSLAEQRQSDQAFTEATGIRFDPRAAPLIIGALVGSRVGEVRAIAPAVFGAMAIISEALKGAKDVPPFHLVAPVAHPALRDHMLRAAQQVGLDDLVLVSSDMAQQLMGRARVMIVKSGTGLHECVIMGVPALMCYRVPRSLAWLLRNVMRFSMPHFAFPNLIAGRSVVPELVQEDCNPERIAEVTSSLMFEQGERDAMQGEFARLREVICRPEPLKRAAEAVLGLLPR